MTETRLTEYSHGAGCACKLSPAELHQIIEPVRSHGAAVHPDLLVGISTSDDAGVYAIGDGRALVQTVDIFTPVVDAPRDWGRIAAANALSDIYAMGAVPSTALQYLAWPRGVLPFELAGEVVTAGMDTMVEAGCTVVGGHSIDSPEPTYGFAVTGLANVEDLVANAGARPGDALVLTKPLGIGIITTAIKRQKCPDDLASIAIEQMATLNATAGAALAPHHAQAATDVTGFGLLGHLREMCVASGVGAEIVVDSVPLLDGVRDLLAAGMWPGGSQRNLQWIEPEVVTDVPVDEWKPLIDAQTSGGLLVALPEDEVAGYIADVPGTARIGQV
ncbi:MAG TPA: selenide, water dikinase SelD, partial [Acidimicrobiia bacterium]|nr:selenide, water dikinase SelD [Acidimicrobiia bacterium]